MDVLALEDAPCEAGADVNHAPGPETCMSRHLQVTAQGSTPLLTAVQEDHTTMLKLLLAHGAEPKGTPLLLAAQQGFRLSAQELLRANADVNGQNNEGPRALG